MRHLPAIVLVGSSLVACMNRGQGTNVDSAESAVDSSDSVGSESDLLVATVDGSETTGALPATGEQVAARIAANIATRWLGGCATVSATGGNVVVHYNDCTGPRGLIHVTGELDLTISVDASGTITVHATSSDLQVNRADLVIDATATYEVTGSEHTLTVSTNGSGTGPRGNAIEHQGNYTVEWDSTSMCGSLMGTWHTDLGALERANDVNLTRCVNACPSGTMTHHFLGGASLTVTFDGTNVATWSASTGASGTVNLLCQ
jgi:hypothetical protein